MYSSDENSAGPIQAADGLHSVGLQTHHEERGRDRAQCHPSTAAEVFPGPCGLPVLPDLLHRPHETHLLCGH